MGETQSAYQLHSYGAFKQSPSYYSNYLVKSTNRQAAKALVKNLDLLKASEHALQQYMTSSLLKMQTLILQWSTVSLYWVYSSPYPVCSLLLV